MALERKIILIPLFRKGKNKKSRRHCLLGEFWNPEILETWNFHAWGQRKFFGWILHSSLGVTGLPVVHKCPRLCSFRDSAILFGLSSPIYIELCKAWSLWGFDKFQFLPFSYEQLGDLRVLLSLKCWAFIVHILLFVCFVFTKQIPQKNN